MSRIEELETALCQALDEAKDELAASDAGVVFQWAHLFFV